MTLKEYNYKVDNFRITYPKPEGEHPAVSSAFCRSIITKWQLELSEDDRNLIQRQEQSFADRQAS